MPDIDPKDRSKKFLDRRDAEIPVFTIQKISEHFEEILKKRK